MYNGHETENGKSIEVMFEHPAIDRTPKNFCAIKFLQKTRIRTHNGLDYVWTLPQTVKITMFTFVSHFRTLSPILKSEALALLSNNLLMFS